jgi:N-acetyl-anhydromuramyl-L-alanine amidase AmpD
MKNLIKQLPWHGTKKWSKRSLSAIDKVVIHQTASTSTIEEVNAYHVSISNHISTTGCPHICYHFVIDKTGEIIQTNRISDLVWHAKGSNYHSIGIMILGDFKGVDHVGHCQVTDEQFKGLSTLLTILCEKYNINKNDVKGHCEVVDYKPSCPGTEIQTYLNSWRNNE